MTPHITIDFETLPIKQRPAYPPRPVGLATKWPGEQGKYLAFGHEAGGNNATWAEAAETLRRVWESNLPILAHHGKFDIEVACRHFQLPMPPWQRLEDTEYLAFLHDPHARSLQLKTLAAKHLGMPPEERDRMVEWCMEFRDLVSAEIGSNFTPSKIGEAIYLVPGGIVAPYAIGDVERADRLFEFYQSTLESMREPYDRERQLMPILLENEQQGLRIDLERLENDITNYVQAFAVAEDWLRKRLNSPGLNIDSDGDTAEALDCAGIVTEWTLTKDGHRSTSKENLRRQHYKDVEVFKVLGWRNRLKTSLDTFLQPWAAQARINAGRITTTWNQVRNPEGGTRTGRPSTYEHNFLNLPKSFEGRASDQWGQPGLSLPLLPLCRDYVLPEEGHLWLHRDFDGQELRGFAHFESGPLLAAYNENPKLDPHDFTKQNILAITGKELERTRVKNGTFSRMYGGGVPAVQWQAQCATAAEAKELIALLDKGQPGRKVLVEEIVKRARLNLPIVTWGGRYYYRELVAGSDKSYKLLNYLVQGSCADLTKQCLIDWHNSSMPWERLLVTVYDEINISAPVDEARGALDRLRQVMDYDRLTCPMRSSAKIGTTWGNAVKEEKWSW